MNFDIMVPYSTRSKIPDVLRKMLFSPSSLCILGLLAVHVVSIKILLGTSGTKKNE